jgi:uncharacterized membrane protein YcaP (DUF421 family)
MNYSVPDYVRSLPEVAFYSFTIYVFLIAGFRLIGRRALGQLTVIDLVILLIMGSAVETAMIGGNISLPAGLVSAATLLLTNRVINVLADRFKIFRRIVGGGTMLVISHGHLIEENMHRIGLTDEDVMEALREHGCGDIENVAYAVMEEDGQISVVEQGANVLRTDKPIVEPPEPVKSS